MHLENPDYALIPFILLGLVALGWMFWVMNPKHQERLYNFLRWLHQANHPSNKKPKKY